MENIAVKIDNTTLETKLNRMEKSRKIHLLRLFKNIAIYTAVLVVIEVCIFIFCSEISDKFVFGYSILFGFTIFLGLDIYQKNKKYIEKFKNKIMPILLEEYNTNWLKDSELISDKELRNSTLFADYNHRGNDDMFSGKYKGVSFKLSETNLLNIQGSGRNKMVYKIFKGIIIVFQLKKDFEAKTIIATKKDRMIQNKPVGIVFGAICIFAILLDAMSKFGIMWTIKNVSITAAIVILCTILFVHLWNRESKKTYDEVKLEDPIFEKEFKVFSQNQIEARYLVTTSFMERFRSLKTAFKTNKAKCSFYDGKIMIALSTNKNLFEIGNLFKPTNNPKQFEKFNEEFKSIMDLIEYFKLDQDTKL